jgi:hypothetical protein
MSPTPTSRLAAPVSTSASASGLLSEAAIHQQLRSRDAYAVDAYLWQVRQALDQQGSHAHDQGREIPQELLDHAQKRRNGVDNDKNRGMSKSALHQSQSATHITVSSPVASPTAPATTADLDNPVAKVAARAARGTLRLRVVEQRMVESEGGAMMAEEEG